MDCVFLASLRTQGKIMNLHTIIGQDSLCTSRSDTAVPPDSIEVVLKAAQAFHIKAVGQIQKRFHFEGDIYKYAEMVDPGQPDDFSLPLFYLC